MKDFDQERQYRSDRDRDFKIAGQHFRARSSVRPEVLMPFSEIDGTTDGAEVLKVIDDLVLNMIEPNDDAHARWRQVRELEGDEAVSLGDLQDLAEWLSEVQMARPSERPGDSSSGPGTTGTT